MKKETFKNGSFRFSGKFWFYVIIAILIRLFFMPITLHYDIIHIWAVPTLVLQHILDPYKYAVSHYPQIAQSTFIVYYGPFAYLVSGFFLFVFQYFSPSFIDWLRQSREIIFTELARPPVDVYAGLISQHQLFINVFLMKLPYLFFELGVVIALFHLVPPKFRSKTILLWLFNPVVIYSTYVFGQDDMLTAGLVLFSILAAWRKRTYVAIFLLVLSTMVKTLPIVLLVPMAYVLGSRWQKRIRLLFLEIGFLFVMNIPWLGDFRRLWLTYFPTEMAGIVDLAIRPDSLATSGKFLAGIMISSWIVIKILKKRITFRPKQTVEIVALTLLLFYSTYRGALINHYILLLAVLTVFWGQVPGGVRKMLIFSLLLFVGHVYTQSLQWRLFLPLQGSAGWLMTFPDSRDVINRYFKYEHLSLLTNTILGVWMLTDALILGKKITEKA